jgi:hypothetical protein
VEPNWENHKHFSINCKILFYMLHRRKMFFIFDQHQLIRMHPHPIHQHQLVGGFDPLLSQLQLTRKHQLPLQAPTYPCTTQPPLFSESGETLYQVFTAYFSASLINIYFDLDCRDTFFSPLILVYVIFKMV